MKVYVYAYSVPRAWNPGLLEGWLSGIKHKAWPEMDITCAMIRACVDVRITEYGGKVGTYHKGGDTDVTHGASAWCKCDVK
jgi:hypothetical protein